MQEGKTHLGAVIGIEAFKISYTRLLANEQVEQLNYQKLQSYSPKRHIQLLSVHLKEYLNSEIIKEHSHILSTTFSKRN